MVKKASAFVKPVFHLANLSCEANFLLRNQLLFLYLKKKKQKKKKAKRP